VIGAAFLQSANRDNDPHLHVHTVIANLVQRADGGDDAYRTLYGRPLLRARGHLDAIAKRRLASKLEKLGIPLVQRADSDGFEVGGVAQEQIDAFSSRKTAVTQGVWTHDGKKRLRGCGCPCDRGEFCGGCGHARCGWHLAPGMEALIEAYTAKHGRPPSRAKVWQLHEQAFRSGRPPKSEEGLSQAQLLDL
jgi:TrwC relaxase